MVFFRLEIMVKTTGVAKVDEIKDERAIKGRRFSGAKSEVLSGLFNSPPPRWEVRRCT